MNLIPLELLPIGQSGRIKDLIGEIANVQRLQEMGLRPGILVEMVQPGSPCIIKIAGNKLCIRGESLFQVLVRECSSDDVPKKS